MFDALEKIAISFVGGPDLQAEKSPNFRAQYDALSQVDKDKIHSNSRTGSLVGSSVGLVAGYYVSKHIKSPWMLIGLGVGGGLLSAIGRLATFPQSVEELKNQDALDWGLGAAPLGFMSGLMYMGIYRKIKG